MSHHRRAVVLVLAFSLLPASFLPAGTLDGRALITRGFELAYNLDHDEAVASIRQAIAADPTDPAAHRAMATILWLNIAFLRGQITVDDYLGRVSRSELKMTPPPAALAAGFQEHVRRALMLAEARVAARPSDADAHYQVGATVGVMASYAATIEGRILAGFKAARRAYDAHERVLQLDPRRRDAAFIVGTYRYIVSTLSLPLRWMAYVAGFGGGKEHGIRLVQEAAAQPSEIQTDAKFALILIYNRERRYDEALRVLRDLQQQYPKNRVLWLEAGSTALRARRFAEAYAHLARGMQMFETDRRPLRMHGEASLWGYKVGAALVGLGRLAEAEQTLRRALAQSEIKAWVRGRIETELGKLDDLAGRREQARAHYRVGRQLAADHNDPIGAREAERWLGERYQLGK